MRRPGLESPKNRTPAALLPYQQRWVADKTGVKVYEKSRRIGISWATAAECASLAASANGQDCWYIGYTKDMALEFIRDVAFWARAFQSVAVEIEEEVLKEEDKDILSFAVKFASGKRVTALSSRPTNLRGKQGFTVIDEAAFHNDLKGLLKAALALRMWGGRVAIISTHDGTENPFNELVLDIRSGKKKRFSIHRTTLDDALAEGLYERICIRKKETYSKEAEAAWRQELLEEYGDDADEELLCIPTKSGGTYLSLALIEACLAPAPVVRLSLDDAWAHKSEPEREAFLTSWCHEHLGGLLATLDPKLQHMFGEDFGRVSDLTVIVPLELGQQLIRRSPFIVELRNVPVSAQKSILFYIVDRLPRFTAGALDKTGNGLALAEAAWEKYGAARIQMVTLNDAWYAAHLPPFKAAFEDKTILLPQDADVRDDLRELQVIDGVPKLPKAKRTGADGRKRHGDAAIGAVLAHYASRLDVAPIEFESLGERRSGLEAFGYSDHVESDRGFGAVGRALDLGGFT